MATTPAPTRTAACWWWLATTTRANPPPWPTTASRRWPAASIPTLYPADAGEFVEFALKGWALSRYSGCWVGFKVVNETVEQAITCAFDLDAFALQLPDRGELPPEGVHYRGTFSPAQDEVILRRWRLPLVQRFARANPFDRLALGDVQARLGIAAVGKCWHEVRLALRALGIDDAVDAARAPALGLSVYKVGLVWPLEPEGLADFARGKSELLVVEDKTAFVETQAAAILYNQPVRPRITGKTDGAGLALLNSDVGFEPLDLALVIAQRMEACGLADEALRSRVQALRSARSGLQLITAPGDVRRTPYFCSGCPHATSTRLPEGSKAFGGIGCHGMASMVRRDTLVATQMGAEGAQWVGLRRFTARPHMFQNLGDGTYYHSGLLAIRAAVASGANITYKILYNDAVAMTGGQPVDGPISVSQIAQQVRSEGVQTIVLVTDDPDRHAGTVLPNGVRVAHRDQLDAIQRELRQVKGCSVLLYEQTCAAEKRRRRKRGALADPDQRMFIHDAVCEGCGDCTVQSGCVSIEPLATPLGTKRRINQSACNKDYSCVKGFCPSFVTVVGGQPRRGSAAAQAQGGPSVPDARQPVEHAALAALPDPARAELVQGSYGVMIPGIGGTGVITVGAVLAMAAHLEGQAASTYDMTGLAQKNGAVYSHLQIAADNSRLRANRLGLGEADLVLGFDLVAALGDESFRTLQAQRTRLIASHRVVPTAMQALGGAATADAALLVRRFIDRLGAARVHTLDATGLATTLMGDAVYANFLVVGAALQLGWLPVGLAAVQRAIELNKVQVSANLRALQLGRLWVHDAGALAALVDGPADGTSPSQAVGVGPALNASDALDALMADRMQRLTDYQGTAYAQRYARLVQAAREAERRVAGSEGDFSTAVAQGFARLMAYKDEYEVARLYSLPSFRQQIAAQFDGVRELRLNLAPPLFSRTDSHTGRPRKQLYGPWIFGALRLLARCKGLRGGWADPFGRSDERRMERALVDDFERRIQALLPALDAGRLPLALRIAQQADQVRGFGPVKLASVAAARLQWQALAQAWDAPAAPAPAGLGPAASVAAQATATV